MQHNGTLYKDWLMHLLFIPLALFTWKDMKIPYNPALFFGHFQRNRVHFATIVSSSFNWYSYHIQKLDSVNVEVLKYYAQVRLLKSYSKNNSSVSC